MVHAIEKTKNKTKTSKKNDKKQESSSDEDSSSSGGRVEEGIIFICLGLFMLYMINKYDFYSLYCLFVFLKK